jgi:signal transduction histidine kinase
MVEPQTAHPAVRLSDEEFKWLSEQGHEIQLEAGGRLSAERDLPDNFYVLLDGELRAVEHNSSQEVIFTCRPEMEAPMLIGAPFLSSAEALRPSRLLRIGADAYLQRVAAISPANNLLISGLVWRLRAAETLLSQNEKMAALGRLSAGLTHELNNPASAVRRAAGHLGDDLRGLYSLAVRLGEHHLTPAQLEHLMQLQQEVAACDDLADLDPLAQSDREQELGEWLESHSVQHAWRLALTLLLAGISLPQLESFAEHLPPESLSDALNWLAGVMAVGRHLNVIEQGTGRISELVEAVKAYSYMDQAALTEVDVQAGLDNTLTILGYKLRGILVERDYAQDLPHITAYGGALNQVWTNLLDNAAEALGGKGRIWIRTGYEDDCVTVEIADNGPGIPPEVQAHLFEPFYTTKPMGQGTGLGLNIAYRIVCEQHGGEIRLRSEPGDTRFTVRLPIHQGSVKEKASTEFEIRGA